MENRLVMYQLHDTNLLNSDMSGKFRQELGFDYFRRVPTKKGTSIFYLFYAREIDTYDALIAAKKIKSISLSRYQPQNRNLPPPAHFNDCTREEMSFHHGHCQKAILHIFLIMSSNPNQSNATSFLHLREILTKKIILWICISIIIIIGIIVIPTTIVLTTKQQSSISTAPINTSGNIIDNK
ncbi:unnamed protein product [Adineta ricciae]|uniref:Uncharacterized protein n=1 Tax=Adineta ricciae TaxID=249248 RepID=A0A815VBX7_ADIRI|nr:unnamed protein product [Adineta ricciae]